MKENLANLIRQSLESLHKSGDLGQFDIADIKIEAARDKRHGDFATNIALLLAGRTGIKPRQLAEKIVAHVPVSELVANIEIAGPGFINFFLSKNAYLQIISSILKAGNTFGHTDHGKGLSILLEFVSANPTGPLHIGHGRGAAYGAALANLLAAAGYKVNKEYYINDSGRQMDILACSVYLRYLQLCGEKIHFPENAYQGDYIKPIAGKMFSEIGKKLARKPEGMDDLFTRQTDCEKQLDDLIELIKNTLGPDDYRSVIDAGIKDILADINDDLTGFGVVFNNWYSERSLLESSAVTNCIEQLKKGGHVYEKDGAWWFRSTAFGDEKDRVVVRENGQLTYFATDIAYHQSKFERGYTRAINIWGADHHGYICRIKAALSALGLKPDNLDILMVQFATLYRGGEKVQMSTRSGQFITLRELREDAGKDATRFFYVMRKSEQHLDFDLDLAKSRSQENPVYYIQYAHARICSVHRQLREKGWQFNQASDTDNPGLLTDAHEQDLLAKLAAWPETVLGAALNYEPHQISYYLRELANEFHAYYNACQILVEDMKLRNARLSLCFAVRQVLRNGLDLLGVSAPETM